MAAIDVGAGVRLIGLMDQEPDQRVLVEPPSEGADLTSRVDGVLMRGISRFFVLATAMGLAAAYLLYATRRFCDETHCYIAQMAPSPWLYAGVAAVAIFTLALVRGAGTRERALAILRRSTLVVGAVFAVAVVVSQVWLHTLPMQDFADSGTNVVPPFLFSSVHVLTVLAG